MSARSHSSLSSLKCVSSLWHLKISTEHHATKQEALKAGEVHLTSPLTPTCHLNSVYNKHHPGLFSFQHTSLSILPLTYLQLFRNFHGHRLGLIISTAQFTSTVHTANSYFKSVISPLSQIHLKTQWQTRARNSKCNKCNKITTNRGYYTGRTSWLFQLCI